MITYFVNSTTERGKVWTVTHWPELDKFSCTCPSFKFGKLGHECKHILEKRKSLNINKNGKL